MKEKICSIFFCVLIGITSLTMIFLAVNNIYFSPKEDTSVVAYDGSKDYPLDNEENSMPKKDSNILLEKFSYFKQVAKNFTSDAFEYRMAFVLLEKRWDKLIGLDMTASRDASVKSTAVVDIGDGRVSYIVSDYYEENVNNMIEFGKSIEDRGMNFLLFFTPFKIDQDDKIQSGVFENYSTEYENKFIAEVSKAGLNVLSVTEAFDKQGLDKQDLFFKTDHHWYPQTALLANGLLCDYLNKNMEFNIDTSIFSEENYDISYWDKNWLGAPGRQVTEVYCKPEPFPIVTPKYDSNITAFISSKNEERTGSIQDVLYNWDILEDKDIYAGNKYYLYSHGDMALLSIHNNNLNDGKRVLLVKRSFADTMIPSLAATIENLDAVDLRVFKGSLQSYIDKTKPDTVIVMYGIGEVERDGSYDFR